MFYRNILEAWIKSGGGSSSLPKSFLTIRNQIIWGNQFIKFNRKCLLFKNWIDVNIVHIDDILNQNGEIDSKFIFDKLTNRQNWISEIHKIKTAIPKQWKNILKTNMSKSTVVGIKSTFTFSNGNTKEQMTLLPGV